ncbi:MAG: tetratricopeptide repeat protein [Candidatus Kaelpia imicola]|nr:tetratricopeptide repeat protein [Candidatus Kaelpia imicola]
MGKNQQNLEFEIEFAERLIQKNPDYIDSLILLGELLTKDKQYQRALEIDFKLKELRPDDPIIFYNLACDYSLLNKKSLSLRALENSLKLGYKDIEYIFKDPDLKNLRTSKRFPQLIEKFNKTSSKV